MMNYDLERSSGLSLPNIRKITLTAPGSRTVYQSRSEMGSMAGTCMAFDLFTLHFVPFGDETFQNTTFGEKFDTSGNGVTRHRITSQKSR